MSKQFWAIIVAVIVVFIGIFAITGNKSSTSGGKSSSGTLTQHVEGVGQDHITLVEYGDYQCPYCAEYYPFIKQAETEFNQQITFQFRNFPLTSLHPNAFAAARAAEAAGLQNKFWQMHDALYDQSDLYYQENEKISNWVGASDPTTFFNQYAQQLGLNVNQFKTDYASTKVNDLVNADMSEGNKLGITGTPTFYIDGKQTQIGQSLGSFETAIKAEIAKKTGSGSTSSTTSAGTTTQTQAPKAKQ
jgi:protein-disulfide isomerase